MIITLLMVVLSFSSYAEECAKVTQFGQLENQFSKLLNRIGCVDLPIGETLPVTYTGEEVGRPIGGRYLLTRTSDSEFKVGLNIGLWSKDKVERTAMRETISACLDSLKGRLLSPDGQSLTFELLDPGSETRILPTEVTIRPAGFRSNSLEFAADIDCPTITHEVLHHLGLVDEYSEKDMSVGNMACRAPGISDSVMLDQVSAQTQSTGEPINLKMDYCSCSSADECGEMSSPDQCVAKGFTVKSEITQFFTQNFKSIEDIRWYVEAQYDGKVSIGGLQKSYRKIFSLSAERAPTRARGSLLYPAHFRMITAPFCEEANRRYSACAKTAYLSTRVEVAGLVLQGGSCPVLPDYCFNGEWLR